MNSGPPATVLHELRAASNRKARQLAPMQPGKTFLYQPRDAGLPHSGETVTVVRAPRADVKNPSVRIRFEDGTEESVPPQRLRAVTGPVYRDAPPRRATRRND